MVHFDHEDVQLFGKRGTCGLIARKIDKDLLYIYTIDYITYRELPKIQAHVTKNPPHPRVKAYSGISGVSGFYKQHIVGEYRCYIMNMSEVCWYARSGVDAQETNETDREA